MPKTVGSFELALSRRHQEVTLTRWLYGELRGAILDRRLRPGARLPATRDFAGRYHVSRGTVVSAFEQLQSEGYLVCRVGAGTWVNERLPHDPRGIGRPSVPLGDHSGALPPWVFSDAARPFRPHDPAVTEFPIQTWARVAGRRLRRASASLLVGRDARGYRPLREAIAGYLGSSRGVNCTPDQIVIVSGAQQGLDLVARLLIKPGDAVWIEDPGYFGAKTAFRNAGAKIIPVPVDRDGLAISRGRLLCVGAKVAYVTPAHQFPMGMTMSLERRLGILAWAREAGAFVIEDDYDSEYRFEGLPVPALQGLDRSGCVILLGSFNKVLFPSLRIGYAVLPPSLVDPFVRFRLGVDLHPSGMDQAILCDFIVQGHLGRHIRRMRELYAGRLVLLQDGVRRYLLGLLEVQAVQAGMNTSTVLQNGMTSQQAEAAALAHGVEAVALSRFAVKSMDVQGLLLGFAAFDQREIRKGVGKLAAALEHRGARAE